MASIEVYRGDGRRPGVPIVEPLLSDSALIHRGRIEMDQNAHPVETGEMDILFRPNIRLGQLIEAIDPTTAIARYSKITGISISVTRTAFSCSISVRHPK